MVALLMQSHVLAKKTAGSPEGRHDGFRFSTNGHPLRRPLVDFSPENVKSQIRRRRITRKNVAAAAKSIHDDGSGTTARTPSFRVNV